MNKLYQLIFLGIALNFNIFALQNDKHNNKAPQRKLTHKEIAKIATATIGCAFFTYAFLMTYPTMELTHRQAKRLPLTERESYRAPLANLPSVATAWIPGTIFTNLPYMLQDSIKKNSGLCGCHISYNLGAIISGALAYSCGIYLHKKLALLKQHYRSKQEITT